MTINLVNLYVSQFTDNLQLLLQDNGGRFSGTVEEGTHIGKQAAAVDQMAAIDAQVVTGRFQPMGRVDAAVDRRWVYPVDYDLPQLVDTLDKLRILVDPKSKMVENAAKAMRRARDNAIVTAFFADAKTGETGGTTTSFLAGNQVSSSLGAAAATGMNVAKLKKGKELLLTHEVDPDNEEIFVAISPIQHTNLLNEIQVISDEYNRPVLGGDGMVKQYMGMRFIIFNRLPVNGSSERRCPMWVRSGMHLGTWNQVSTSISQRNDLQSEPWQAYAMGTFGATRLEEKRVVEIPCAE